MSGSSRIFTAVASFGLLLSSIGCCEKKEPLVSNEPDQNAQSAADRIRELENQLAQAERDKLASDQQLMAMRQELDDLRGKLSAAPAPAPGWENVPGGAMTSIDGTVLFDSGKAVLKSSAKRTLDQVVSVVNEKFPEHDVYVFGHTDSTPIKRSTWKDNEELSCQRALAVMRFLRGAGVQQKIAAAGWGDQIPIADNSAASARQANRRVQIFAMTPQEALSGAAVSTPRGTANRAP